MLDNFEVLNILNSLLHAKTNSAVACTAIDIQPIVSELLLRNPDLIYAESSRILRNRKNNARIRFVTTLTGASSLVGVRFENVFILKDIDSRIGDLLAVQASNTVHFELFGG